MRTLTRRNETVVVLFCLSMALPVRVSLGIWNYDDDPEKLSLLHKIEIAVREAYPAISKDESESLRRSLESVLLDPNNAMSSDEQELALECLQPGLSRWKFDEPNQFAWFTVTTTWVLREYFEQKSRFSPEELEARRVQLAWQKSIASTLIAQLTDAIGKGQEVDPRTKELINALDRDLKREMENPLNPFFRPPLAQDKWQEYCAAIENEISEEIARLRTRLEQIDHGQLDQAAADRLKVKRSLWLRLWSLGRNSPGPTSDEEWKKNRKWMEYQSCVTSIAMAVVRKYCAAHFPPPDSPRFAPFKIKTVGVSCELGSPVRVRLTPWTESPDTPPESPK